MLSFILRSYIFILASAAIVSVHAEPASPLPSAESFFENSNFSGAVLSPNAKSLAVRMTGKNGRDALAVMDVLTLKAAMVAHFADADIGNFRWVNDERLVFDTVDRQFDTGMMLVGPGLYAVNRDSTQLQKLVSRGFDGLGGEMYHGKPLPPVSTTLSPQLGRQDSDFVFVSTPHYSTYNQISYVEFQRMNTVSGQVNAVGGPRGALSWMLDQNGEPRIATVLESDVEVLYYRDPASDEWRKLTEHKIYSREKNDFSPWFFGPDGTLYVTARRGGDKSAVFTYDLLNNKVSEKPLIAMADYDFNGQFVFDDKKALGLHYQADEDMTLWFDDNMKAMQKSVDALLPATANRISVARRAQIPFVLVSAYSDVQPTLYFLYNTESKSLTKIGSAYDKINPRQMGHKEMVRYKARDGLTIPAYLTIPPGREKKNLPLVMLVHGGPWVRGVSWSWNPMSQFLASRGYVVLEPEYRGSTGFGNKHAKAGFKQWGLKMQDDIADGAKWAVSEGLVDPKRICIAGASYGGYATLMGLVNDPELYKCGIEWAGVTDINLLYNSGWRYLSDVSEDTKSYGLPMMVGDPVKDAEQLKATSPIEQATRLKQPLLIAYGDSDRRVPLVHGLKFRDAVTATNPNVEWVVYEKEGHGWALPKNRIDFGNRIEKFLEKNIGKP